jgi:hypothetical protein
MKTKTSLMGNSMNRSPMRLPFLHIPLLLAFAWFALSPQARAICQEGCLTNDNTVLGDDALTSLTTGSFNTATGVSALRNNRRGDNNTATGFLALSRNETGDNNTATGAYALQGNRTGHGNTANGKDALQVNTTGDINTAIGWNTLAFNTTGDGNVAVGFDALVQNTGSNNIAVGTAAGANLTTGSSNIDIGNVGLAGTGESYTIRIGESLVHMNTYIAGIYGVALASGSSVRIDSSGHLGTVASSARFEREIKPMNKASEAILALHPVTFRYKEEIDAEGIPQFGLVAEEVEKVDPALVERDQEGRPYSVRYEAVNAMLLNEFLKEHRKVEKLEAGFVQQQKDLQAIVAHQQKQIEALTAGLQKVSTQLATASPSRSGLETTKQAQQMVLNNQ